MSELQDVKRRPAKMLGKWFHCGSYGDTLHEAIVPINEQLKLYGFELVHFDDGTDCYRLGLVNHMKD